MLSRPNGFQLRRRQFARRYGPDWQWPPTRSRLGCLCVIRWRKPAASSQQTAPEKFMAEAAVQARFACQSGPRHMAPYSTQPMY